MRPPAGSCEILFVQMQTFVGSRRHKASASISGRFFPSFAIVAKVSPALAVDEADDQRRNGKHAHNATEYHDQPNSPATVVLNNLKG